MVYTFFKSRMKQKHNLFIKGIGEEIVTPLVLFFKINF